MKKHDLYFEIKKNLFLSLSDFFYKSIDSLSKWIDKFPYNENINTLQDLIKLISEALNLSFFLNFASIIQISVI